MVNDHYPDLLVGHHNSSAHANGHVSIWLFSYGSGLSPTSVPVCGENARYSNMELIALHDMFI